MDDRTGRAFFCTAGPWVVIHGHSTHGPDQAHLGTDTANGPRWQYVSCQMSPRRVELKKKSVAGLVRPGESTDRRAENRMSTKLVSTEQAKAALMPLKQLTERPTPRGAKRLLPCMLLLHFLFLAPLIGL
jgi:hypothetical protein